MTDENLPCARGLKALSTSAQAILMQLCEAETIIMPILQTRKLRLAEVEFGELQFEFQSAWFKSPCSHLWYFSEVKWVSISVKLGEKHTPHHS